eukprot:CAMPEP_0184557184 /NCGR_PEP_ID=MMETSP0199_2-20130426/42090_1 /TAXON_ID=1112570 /ORGANISM="Thraustochytrium sp., Strain LLF1b" /LENGTH=55 /DNA_ID=CAMNT_0026954045 /DNA_START=517 /DNA_END=680 /DNA_ORIENTATION=+
MTSMCGFATQLKWSPIDEHSGSIHTRMVEGGSILPRLDLRLDRPATISSRWARTL